MGIFLAIMNVLPLVTQIIQALQVAFPQKGQGATKAALVPIVLGAAVDQHPGLLPPGITKEQLVAMGTALASPMVESMKTTGALAPSITPQTIAP